MAYRYHSLLIFFIASGLSGCAGPQGASSEGLLRIANSPSVTIRSSGENPLTRTMPLTAGDQAKDKQDADQSVQKSDPIYAVGNAEFIAELGKELDICYTKANEYRGAFDHHRSRNKWIAGIGIIAGSIAVPVLAAASSSAALVAGFGGVSGAVNAYQLTLDSQGDSPAAAAAVYKSFTNGIQSKLANLKDVQMGPPAAALILELRAYCAMTPLPEASNTSTIPDPVAVAKQKADVAEQLKRQKEAEAVAAEAEKRKREAEKGS